MPLNSIVFLRLRLFEAFQFGFRFVWSCTSSGSTWHPYVRQAEIHTSRLTVINTLARLFYLNWWRFNWSLCFIIFFFFSFIFVFFFVFLFIRSGVFTATTTHASCCCWWRFLLNGRSALLIGFPPRRFGVCRRNFFFVNICFSSFCCKCK